MVKQSSQARVVHKKWDGTTLSEIAIANDVRFYFGSHEEEYVDVHLFKNFRDDQWELSVIGGRPLFVLPYSSNVIHLRVPPW